MGQSWQRSEAFSVGNLGAEPAFILPRSTQVLAAGKTINLWKESPNVTLSSEQHSQKSVYKNVIFFNIKYFRHESPHKQNFNK